MKRPMKLILASAHPNDNGIYPAAPMELPASPESVEQAAREMGLQKLERGAFQIVGTAPDELAALWQYIPFDALDFSELNQLAYQLSRFTDAQREDFLSLLAERRQDEEESLEDVLSIARECAEPDGLTLGPVHYPTFLNFSNTIENGLNMN